MKHLIALTCMLIATCQNNYAQTQPTIEDWQYLGTATFTDGWIMPYFDKTSPSDRTWEIVIEKSATSEIYRLIDPYHQPGFISKLQSKPNTDTRHDIIIDCTEPEFVRVEHQPIFTFTSDNKLQPGKEQSIWGKCQASYREYLGNTPAAITAYGLNSTMHGNTITIKQACFGFSSDPSDTQTWNAGTFDTVIQINRGSSLTTPAIDHTPHNPEYYTITGIRITSPSTGQPYLKRTGTTATKHINR